jgi:hypothetical protein
VKKSGADFAVLLLRPKSVFGPKSIIGQRKGLTVLIQNEERLRREMIRSWKNAIDYIDPAPALQASSIAIFPVRMGTRIRWVRIIAEEIVWFLKE